MIISSLFSAVATRWDHRHSASCVNKGDKGISIVILVGNDRLRIKAINIVVLDHSRQDCMEAQSRRLRAIRGYPIRQLVRVIADAQRQ